MISLQNFDFTIENKYASILFLLLPIIILLHFYFMHHAKKMSFKFGNFQAMKRVEGKRIISKNFTMLFMIIIIVSLMILSLMNITLWTKGNTLDSNYIILLDSGASMNARDITPDRYTFAKEISNIIVDNITGVKIGFISFGGTIEKSESLTYEKEKIHQSIYSSEISDTGTDIGLAIISAIEKFGESNQSNIIILISDGHDTVGIPLSDAIKKAEETHVKIFTIGVGTVTGGEFLKTPEKTDIISKLNEKNLKNIANRTSSTYINVDSMDKIELALTKINEESKIGFIQYNLKNTFIMTAILLLFIMWILENTRFRIFP